MIPGVIVIAEDVIVAVVGMIRHMGAAILLLMVFSIIAQVSEDLKEIQVEEGVDELVEQYCNNINLILRTKSQVVEL